MERHLWGKKRRLSRFAGRVDAGVQLVRINLRCADMFTWVLSRQDSGGKAGLAIPT